ncbi:ParA family protein [Spirosoma oryzicola]|uniref:ParA family protein n=1 Tax=Spirosoma oryzicola TaxID=2898794 RepID=UPI001E5BBC39|nr:ParA family protein [Spirosoma oryzicola]UHG94694.1 ParA family protein [Spirosoma oryzicola]
MTSSTQQPQSEAAAGLASSPKVIAFATQKGGMGKTTLSVLVASWLHYKRGIKVAILDVDGSQLSVYNQRVRESQQIETDEELMTRLNEQDIEPYPILSGYPGDVPALLKELPGDVQLVFIDMPGNIEVDGYETAIKCVDLLIVPMETSEYSVTTGISYLNAIQEINLLPVDRCRIVWNKYKPSRDGELADLLEGRFKDIDLLCLKSRIPQRDSYQDSANRSTLFPMPTNYLRNSGLKDLFPEIETLVSITANPTSDDE